ncbi:MAG: chemotaxis protein CheA [Planctomycetes bacterium]|nr:chemotaxis protein CheA [Planctomycetota bacterium]
MDELAKNQIRAIAEQLNSLDPTDKDSLVKAGIALETASQLEFDSPEHKALIEAGLAALQAAYQDQLVDARGELQKHAAILAGLAGGCDEQAAELSADEIAGMLLGMAPSDEQAIKQIHQASKLLAQKLGQAPAAEAAHAVACIEKAMENPQDEAASQLLGEAAASMAKAASLCEQEALEDDAPASPTPDEAVAQTPAENVQQPQPAPPASPPAQPKGDAPQVSAVLPLDIDMELLKEYMVESLDHLLAAQTSLLELENDPEAVEPINTVFRAFHTIKGTSGFLGLEAIQRLAHLSENLLDRAREGQIKIIGGYADISLRSCDALKFMIEALGSAQPGGELSLAPGFEDLMAKLADPEAAGISDDTDPAEMRLGDILVGRGAATRDAVESAADVQEEKPIGRVLLEKDVATAAEVANALRVQKGIKNQPAPGAENTIRVGTERLDSLINMVGELVIAQSMVAQDPNVTSGERPRLTRSVLHAGKIVRELQDLSMSLRMVPLKPTFQKMARLVRDLAKKSQKSVRFVTEGEDTEIDRNMVEIINDPLVHMIRNAVDHGIEPADERTAAGKDAVGTVTLRAYQVAGNVVLELQDDGRGLNKRKILAKAVERGLIGQNDDLSENEIFGLIFHAGFSTADKVTDVSGRGVGMDVVKKNIEKLRGRIEISSEVGKGSVFCIRLPLTMAITDAMMVRLGDERFLLPTVSIEKSFRPEKGSVTQIAGKGRMVMLRGQLLPLFRLADLFEVPDAIEEPTEGLLVVIEGGGKKCALMVDELLGQQQVVIKHLGKMLSKIPGVSGGAILGDGRVGLILDTTGLIALANGDGMQEAA